jgi:hypothetical protein
MAQTQKIQRFNAGEADDKPPEAVHGLKCNTAKVPAVFLWLILFWGCKYVTAKII